VTGVYLTYSLRLAFCAPKSRIVSIDTIQLAHIGFIMARYCFIMLMILFVISSAVWAQDDADDCQPATGDPISIGAVFPSQSLFTQAANDPYQGVAAMVDAVNACGGVNGRPVALVYVPASSRAEARAAVTTLTGSVPLVIGSGSLAVSEVLLDASTDGAFLYWEVSEMLDSRHEWAFSPLLGSFPFGTKVAEFINSQVVGVLEGNVPRIALVYEDRPRSQSISRGINAALAVPPLIDHRYQHQLTNGYRLAVDMREDSINTVIVVAFDQDTDRLWYDMREANANVEAWIQVGGDTFRRNTCNRLGNTDALISIGLSGSVNNQYRLDTIGAVYGQYSTLYQQQFGRVRSETADLAASSTYLVLNFVLPNVEGDFTPESVRSAILSAEVDAPAGLMGEGLSIQADSGENGNGVAVVQQRQHDQFCTIFPSAVATCATSLQSFPTWRERVTDPQYATCGS
jgi:hypothetical protein